MSDFQIADQGSIFLIRPLNEAARQWLDENVISEPWQWVQSALCVEARFARDLIIEIERPASKLPADRLPSPDASRMRRGCSVGASRSQRRPRMCFAILAWLVLLYFFANKPGWFACLLVLLVVGILVAGC